MTFRSAAHCLLLCLIVAGYGSAYAQKRPEPHIMRLIGEEAVRCGTYERPPRVPHTLSDEELSRARQCISNAWAEGKPFFVSIGGMGIDSYVASGALGLPNGSGLYRFGYDSAPCGGPGCPERFNLSLCAPVPEGSQPDVEKLCRLTWKTAVVQRPPPSPQSTKQACVFDGLKLPDDFLVLASGAYAGRKIGFQIDGSGHGATQFDVFVNRTDKPVVLMLGAYEPTIWNISWSAGTRILGVLASGYHRQVIAGLDPKVPTLISSYDNKAPCGYFYVARNRLGALNPLARRLFGKDVDLVYFGEKGVATIGEALQHGGQWLRSTAVTPESFHDKAAPLAGRPALEDAVRRGVLRQATRADAAAWGEAAARRLPARALPPIAGEGGPPRPVGPWGDSVYVVMGRFTFPSGLYGGNSVTFYVPENVPKPSGNPGHSAVFEIESGTCLGPICPDLR